MLVSVRQFKFCQVDWNRIGDMKLSVAVFYAVQPANKEFKIVGIFSIFFCLSCLVSKIYYVKYMTANKEKEKKIVIC